MDINTKLIVKVQFNDEIRKMPIHNEDITYDELTIMMERVFKHKLNGEDEIIIKYKDEDNDLITISDDSDLAFAIESSNILKLCLTIENQNKEEPKINKDLNFNEVNAIRRELQTIRDNVNRLLDKLVHPNDETSGNTVASGRTSAAGGKDVQEIIGGKEFDPLSVGTHSQLAIVERTETSNSLVSNSRNDDNKATAHDTGKMMNHQEIHPDHKDMHDSAAAAANLAKNQNVLTSMGHMTGHPQVQSTLSSTTSTMPSNMAYNQNISSNMIGQNIPSNLNRQNMSPSMGHQMMPPNIGVQNMQHNFGSQNMPPNMGGQNMPPNMGSQNMPPTMGVQNMPPNMGGQNMPPSMGGQNMPPSMGGQNMPPSMGGQNMPPNMGGQNMPPNMGGQNMPPNMGGQNMPPNMGGPNMPPNMGGQNMPPTMGGQNMPPNMGVPNMPPNIGGTNIQKSTENPMHTMANAPSAFTGNTSGFSNPQSIPTQRQLYPSAMQPPRLSASNFHGPSAIPNTGASQIRAPGSYVYPQNPQFNPALSQSNPNYGYQPSQK